MKKIFRFLGTYSKALIKAFWIFGPGVLTAKGRSAVWRISHENLSMEREIQPIFSPVELGSLCDGIDVRIVPSDRQTGDVTDPELMAICALVRRASPKQIFEIGTFRGRTTLHLALNSPTDTNVFTLDLPKENAERTAYKLDHTAHHYIGRSDQGECFLKSSLPERQKITQLWGDSAEFDFGPYEGHCDFVFVDGAHSYDYVVNDTELAFSLLRNGGGIIVWHDYGVKRQLGVTKGLESLAQDPRFKRSMSQCSWIPGTTLAYVTVGLHGKQ